MKVSQQKPENTSHQGESRPLSGSQRNILCLLILLLAAGIMVLILSGCSRSIKSPAAPNTEMPSETSKNSAEKPQEPESSTPLPDLSGNWIGSLTVGSQNLKLHLRLELTPVGYQGALVVPQQSSQEIPISSVSLEQDKLVVSFDSIHAEFEVPNPGSDSLSGSWKQSGATFPLIMNRSEEGDTMEIHRIQDPQPPYPYLIEEVTFTQQQEQFTLAGTVTRPNDTNTHPAVVLISGSGSQNRNEEIFGHKPFLVLADALTRKGFVVLRFDDRGVGGSQGSPAQASVQDLGMDALSARDWLVKQPYTDPLSIGFIGHSEGGAIAPYLASEYPGTAFIVTLAGTGVPGTKVLLSQTRALLEAQNYPEAMIQTSQKANTTIYDLILSDRSREEKEKAIEKALLQAGVTKADAQAQLSVLLSPWYLSFLTYNPADYITKLSIPVFSLQGTKDLQVLPDLNLSAIKQALDNNPGKHPLSQTKAYEGLNHLFQPAETGLVQEYGTIEITIAPEVLEDITDWLLKVTAVSP